MERRELRSLIATITEAEEQKAAEAEHAHVTAREELRNRATDRIQELSRTLDDRIMELVRRSACMRGHTRSCCQPNSIRARLGGCRGVPALLTTWPPYSMEMLRLESPLNAGGRGRDDDTALWGTRCLLHFHLPATAVFHSDASWV